MDFASCTRSHTFTPSDRAWWREHNSIECVDHFQDGKPWVFHMFFFWGGGNVYHCLPHNSQTNTQKNGVNSRIVIYPKGQEGYCWDVVGIELTDSVSSGHGILFAYMLHPVNCLCHLMSTGIDPRKFTSKPALGKWFMMSFCGHDWHDDRFDRYYRYSGRSSRQHGMFDNHVWDMWFNIFGVPTTWCFWV